MTGRESTNTGDSQAGGVPRVFVPPGVPAWITPELIADTIRVWQPYYAVPLTPDDAVGIILTVGQLVRVLSSESPP